MHVIFDLIQTPSLQNFIKVWPRIPNRISGFTAHEFGGSQYKVRPPFLEGIAFNGEHDRLSGVLP
jgi:hypothetical protein